MKTQLVIELTAVKNQIIAFAKLSKTRLTVDEKKALLAAWESANRLRAVIYSRIELIENKFSNN